MNTAPPSPDQTRLILILDEVAQDLADDLEWALNTLRKHADRLPNEIYQAECYVAARRHLRARHSMRRAIKTTTGTRS